MSIKITKLIHKVQNICIFLTLAIMGAVSMVIFKDLVLPSIVIIEYVMWFIYLVAVILIYDKVKIKEEE